MIPGKLAGSAGTSPAEAKNFSGWLRMQLSFVIPAGVNPAENVRDKASAGLAPAEPTTDSYTRRSFAECRISAGFIPVESATLHHH